MSSLLPVLIPRLVQLYWVGAVKKKKNGKGWCPIYTITKNENQWIYQPVNWWKLSFFILGCLTTNHTLRKEQRLCTTIRFAYVIRNIFAWSVSQFKKKKKSTFPSIKKKQIPFSVLCFICEVFNYFYTLRGLKKI